MKRLNPDKLKVTFKEGVTPYEPIIPRRYTLTHSDITSELFLDIGKEFNITAIGPMRDEVLAEWYLREGIYGLSAYCYVGGNTFAEAALRYTIFRKELPLALEAMRYGDRRLFQKHPVLKNSQVWIYFDTTFKAFNRLEYWGTFKDYE